MAVQPPSEDSSPAAWRLTFAYERDEVRIVSCERVAMQAPPDDHALLEQGRSGYWVEIRGADNAILYQQVLHNPIRTDAEVFPEDPSEPIRRVPIEHPQGVFDVVVPDLPDGHVAVLHGRASRQELRERPSKQLVKVRLHDQPGMSREPE